MPSFKKCRIQLLKELRDIVDTQRESDDIPRREQRRLRDYCREIDKWIKEMEKDNE